MAKPDSDSTLPVAWREAVDLVILKLPGQEEVRLSEEGVHALLVQLAEVVYGKRWMSMMGSIRDTDWMSAVFQALGKNGHTIPTEPSVEIFRTLFQEIRAMETAPLKAALARHDGCSRMSNADRDLLR